MAEEATKEGSTEASASVDAGEFERIRQENEVLKNKAVKFDQIEKRFQSDANFRDTLQKAWKGEYGEAAKAEAKKAVADNNDGNLSARQLADLEKKLADYETKLEALAHGYVGDKVTNERDRVNYQYEQTFADIAESKGYRVGSPEYNALFKSTKDEAYKLARKYNLVDNNGNPDPTSRFNQKLIEESVKNAIDEFDAMGYDIKERQRKLSEQKRKQSFQRKEDELKKLIDMNKDKLKTAHGKGKFLDDYFRQRLRDANISEDSI